MSPIPHKGIQNRRQSSMKSRAFDTLSTGPIGMYSAPIKAALIRLTTHTKTNAVLDTVLAILDLLSLHGLKNPSPTNAIMAMVNITSSLLRTSGIVYVRMRLSLRISTMPL